jgi:hypothetical protein
MNNKECLRITAELWVKVLSLREQSEWFEYFISLLTFVISTWIFCDSIQFFCSPFSMLFNHYFEPFPCSFTSSWSVVIRVKNFAFSNLKGHDEVSGIHLWVASPLTFIISIWMWVRFTHKTFEMWANESEQKSCWVVITLTFYCFKIRSEIFSDFLWNSLGRSLFWKVSRCFWMGI